MNIKTILNSPDKPNLVLCHGWGFDLTIWQTLADSLKDHFNLYMVDLPGFGLTPWQPEEQFLESCKTFLPPKFHLMGWSLGGLFAIKLAGLLPDRVKSYVSVTSSPCFQEHEGWPGITIDVLNSFSHSLTENPQETLKSFILLQSKGQKYESQGAHMPSIKGLEEGMRMLKTYDLRQELVYFKMPTLYIFGRLDAIVPSRTMSVMQKQYPQFNYYLFRKGAHMPFISHPSEFVSLICEFML